MQNDIDKTASRNYILWEYFCANGCIPPQDEYTVVYKPHDTYEFVFRPDGTFLAAITEPEDRTFNRDLSEVLLELNLLNEHIKETK